MPETRDAATVPVETARDEPVGYLISPSGWSMVEETLREHGATAEPVVCRTPCRGSKRHSWHLTAYGHRELARVVVEIREEAAP